MSDKQSRTLNRIIFVSLAGAGSIVIIVFAAINITLDFVSVGNAFKERLQTTQKLFVNSIYNEVLSGANSEIYRKCKTLFNEPLVSAIIISGPDDSGICEFRREQMGNITALDTPIYFNSENQDMAANIHIEYSLDFLTKLRTEKLMVSAFSVTAFILIMFLFSKFLSNYIADPISELILYLSEIENTKIPLDISILKNRKIKEIDALTESIFELKNRLEDHHSNLVLLSKKEAKLQISQQVAHDIASPLSALAIGLGQSLSIEPNLKQLFNSAIQRVRDISEKLKKPELEENLIFDEVSLKDLIQALREVFNETKTRVSQLPNIDLRLQMPTLEEPLSTFLMCDIGELKTVLSNLLNNAIDAIGSNNGMVSTILSWNASSFILNVIDNGKGIPSQILSAIGSRGLTFGKNAGTGLGLYHAKKNIMKFGGQFEISSEIGKGTQIMISLPRKVTQLI